MTRIRLARGASLIGYFGLLALVSVWTVSQAPADRIPLAPVLILAVVPLLVMLRGILHGRARAHFWTSIVALLYMGHGVVELLGETGSRLLPTLEIVLSLTLYFGAVFYARFRARELRLRAAEGKHPAQAGGSS